MTFSTSAQGNAANATTAIVPAGRADPKFSSYLILGPATGMVMPTGGSGRTKEMGDAGIPVYVDTSVRLGHMVGKALYATADPLVGHARMLSALA